METLLTYFARTVIHSTVAAAVVELVLLAWGITDPQTRFRMRVPALVFPPLTACLAPLAVGLGWPPLLRVAPWGGMSWGPVSVAHGAVTVALGMVMIFLFQEVQPWLQDGRRALWPQVVAPVPGSRLEAALAQVFLAAPARPVTCHELPLRARALSIRHIKGRDALVYSAGFPDWLDDDELRAVLAHERAHLDRGDIQLRRWLYACRVVQVFSPLALVEYRHLVHDSEEACDGAAVLRTGAPMALASALLKAHGGTPPALGGESRMAGAARLVEHASRSVRLQRRVRRLLFPPPPAQASALAVGATSMALTALLLGVV